MTQPAQVLLMAKLAGRGIVLAAGRHNCRELPAAANIDPARSHLNEVLRGPDTASGIAALAKSMMKKAGIKALRKDAVQALEIIFSLPPSSGIDAPAFFESAIAWAERSFEGAPILSAIVHQDEGAPHCHVLLLPLIDGRMVGGALMGGPGKFNGRQAAFHNQVGRRFGLTRQTPAQPRQERPNATDRRNATRSKLDEIKRRYGLVITPEAEADLIDLIDAPRSKRGSSTFVGIMTKPVKPDRSTWQAKSIDFEAPPAPRQVLPLTSPGLPEVYPVKDFAAAPPASPSAPVQTVETVPAVVPTVDAAPAIAARRSRPASPMRVRAIASMRAMLARPSHALTVRTRPETLQVRCRPVASSLRGGP